MWVAGLAYRRPVVSDMEVIVRHQGRERFASITCMIRHYVARRAQVTEGHPHNADVRAGFGLRLRAIRGALAAAPNDVFGYLAGSSVLQLRTAVADHLNRRAAEVASCGSVFIAHSEYVPNLIRCPGAGAVPDRSGRAAAVADQRACWPVTKGER
jgi:hypothetical protein